MYNELFYDELAEKWKRDKALGFLIITMTRDISLIFLFCLILLSCHEEQGNWTTVHQEGAYIYGVWKSRTAKIAAQAMIEVSTNIRAQADQVLTPLKRRVKESLGQTDIAPEQLLPVDDEASGWVRSRTPSTYHGTTLYRDRAASPELYYAYGFQQQAEVEYQNPRFGSKPLILLEIFDMETPENAFGIYSFSTYPQAKFEWVGSSAMLSGGYLRFSKGKYFIQIEGYEFATGIREGMIMLAKSVAARIKAPSIFSKSDWASILTLLPNNKVNGSVKLFRTNWALNQIYKTLPVPVPQLNDEAIGISALYKENYDSATWMDAQIVFILCFPEPSMAESAYILYRQALAEQSVPIEIGVSGEILINEHSVPE